MYDVTTVLTEQERLIEERNKLSAKRKAINSMLRHLCNSTVRTKKGEEHVKELVNKFKDARNKLNRYIYNIDQQIQAFNGTLKFQGDL